MSHEISLEEINRWLESIADEPSDIASRAYISARHKYIGVGEPPKWCRGQWHNLKAEYRDFLVSFVREGLAQRASNKENPSP
ncbi:protein of unknown function [Hyphomicrobium sp. MC1]|nr:protein of unknown function [Hyphomicrobium sp. MC1]